MDNFIIDVVGESMEDLELAIKLAFTESNCPGGTVKGYSCKDGKLALHWAESTHSTPLPFPFHVDVATALVEGWWRDAATLKSFPPRPDIDGDCHRGWHLYNHSRVADGIPAYAVFVIEPAWALHGK